MRFVLDRNSCDEIRKPSQKRKIKPTRRSVSGVYAFRGETSIEFESTLERDFIIRTEFFLNVLDVIPQPAIIPFRSLNGHPYTYTPDFLVYYRLGTNLYENYPKPALIEVKPESEWKRNRQEWLPKWKAAHRYAKEQGWTFHIHDESRIRDQTLFNIRFLEFYKRMQFPQEESHWVIENIREMGSAPIHYLIARHFMGIYKAEGIAHIWHLLATRKLDGDLSLPLNDLTILWVPNNG
jgi:hypothetical protein